jgi:hypothetical protein
MLSCMQARRRLAASIASLAAMSAFAFACSSNHKDGSGGLGAGKGGAGGATGGTSSSGGSSATSSGGSSTVVLTGGSSGTSGSGNEGGDGAIGTTCGGDVHQAMLLPLDLYVMLDSSGSMLDTIGTRTKWEAIQSAITTFINDPASAGIGIGLQFFPQKDPNIPDTCSTTAQCGDNNLCLNNFCKNAGPKIYVCDTGADCMQGGQDFGPCTPLTYCWSSGGTTFCHDDTECSGGRGDCVPFNQCSGNKNLICKQAGAACKDTDGTSYGTCVAQPPQCEKTANCAAAAYAAPAAEIATLPGAAASLGGVIMPKMPEGQTPTAPALQGAIQHAETWAGAHAGHAVAVVLATDGLPTECIADTTNDPSGIAGVVTIAKAGVSASPSIQTFVIGVFSQADDMTMNASGNLDQIATAGGTAKAHIVGATGNVEQDFLDALDEIRGSRLPCNFQLPESTSGTFDKNKVNVVFNDGSQNQTLYYWPDAKSCDPKDGGWYYDDPNAPTQIIACPASCTAIQNASGSKASVNISLGCNSLVK